MTVRPTDLLERLEKWADLSMGLFTGLRADLRLAIEEIRRLRSTTERCSYSPTGFHVYALFPMGPDGRIATVGHMISGVKTFPSGSFCQHCNKPEPLRSSAA